MIVAGSLRWSDNAILRLENITLHAAGELDHPASYPSRIPLSSAPEIFSEKKNSTLVCATVAGVRTEVAAAALLVCGLLAAPTAAADPADPAPADDPTSCNIPACTPGIQPGIVLGSPCDNTTYYVFGVTDWGRLVFCGSPRRLAPRWFRTTNMLGVKSEGSSCPGREGSMAQGPDGLFLSCDVRGGASLWTRGDI
jgi:hypothetical protein